MKLKLVIAACASVLSGCNPHMSAEQICKAEPELCADMGQKGWCRRGRNVVIHSRYEHFKEPSGDNMYDQLVALDEYNKCMSLVVNMRDRDGVDGEHTRGYWFAKSNETMDNLLQETAKSDDPVLALYHWSRHNDKEAMARFLTAESEGRLKTRRSKLMAAVYFSKSEPEKGLTYIHDLLSNTPVTVKYDKSLLELAATTYRKLEKNERAMVFALIVNRSKVATELLADHYQVKPNRIDRIEKEASNVKELLNDGKFDPNSWKL